jgi:hypothetical protein
MLQRGYPNLELVNDSIRSLYRSLKAVRIKGFSDDLLPEAALDKWSDPVISTQALASRIAVHFRLAVTTVVVTFSSALPVPGRVELSSSSDFFIEIHAEYRSQPDCIAAILAHEIAHIFLHQHRVSLEPEFRNEVLTDTTAAYLGCGILIMNGASETEESVDYNRIERRARQCGYITVDEFGYVLAKRDLLFSHDSSRDLKPGLPVDGYFAGRNRFQSELSKRPLVPRPLPERLLRWMRRILLRRKEQINEVVAAIVFGCPCCSQSLRIPSTRSILSVRCPVCDSHFRCYS